MQGNQAVAVTDPPMPATSESVDMGRVGAFMGTLMGDLSGAMTCVMCLIGDRLGLFTLLAGLGPCSSADLARAAGLNERYVREWLAALNAAGYLSYDAAAAAYSLPREHALALAYEGNPLYVGGAFQQLAGLTGPLTQVVNGFRTGAGVPDAAYGDDLLRGMERLSAGWFDHLLVQQWIASLPDLAAKLRRGAWVADVGSGSGRALMNLARAFPTSRFVGFDTSAEVVQRAMAAATAAGLTDRLRFERRDVIDGLPRQFDVVTLFDVLHDAREPRRLLESIRHALPPDGTLLLSEINCAEQTEQNNGPVATIMYGTSVLYCLPTSLARGGQGLGTMGLPEPKVRALCLEAGFSQVQRLPVQHEFNVLYQVCA